MSEQNPVLFYSTRGNFGEFSNWYTAWFELDGKTWKSSEHYFMAQKTTNKKEQEKIRKTKTPREAKKFGRAVQLRSGWEGMKFEIMVKACYAKFSQNERLKELLLSTGDRPIHENCSDPHWGGGPNYPKGKDLLGKALMKVRDMIKDGDKNGN